MQKKINMKDFNEKINIFSDSVGEKIQQTGEYLAPKAEELKEKAKTKIQQTSEYLAPKAEELKEKTKAKIQQTSEYLAPKIEELKEKTKTKIQQTGEYLAPKAEELKEKAKAKMQQTSENLAQKTGELKENTKAKIQQTSENLTSKAKKLKEKTKAAAKKVPKYAIPIVCLAFFLDVFFPGVFSDGKDLYVISIGVPTYKNYRDIKDLEQNQDDAERISEIFRRQSGHLFSNIYYKTLAKHGEASNGNVEKAINQVYKKADENDVVLIYISSHGQEYENEYLLLLYDSDRKDIYNTSFKAKNLIKNSKIKTIVWIDACESRTAAKDLEDNNVNLLVSSDRYSYCDLRGSAFTNTLRKGLNCEADYDENGIVSLQEITEYVVRNVQGQDASNPITNFDDVDLVKCRD